MKLAEKLSEKVLRLQGERPAQVAQMDLIELIQLSKDVCAARRRYREKKKTIAAAIRAGAALEDGVFSAQIERREGKTRNYETLVVR